MRLKDEVYDELLKLRYDGLEGSIKKWEIIKKGFQENRFSINDVHCFSGIPCGLCKEAEEIQDDESKCWVCTLFNSIGIECNEWDPFIEIADIATSPEMSSSDSEIIEKCIDKILNTLISLREEE